MVQEELTLGTKKVVHANAAIASGLPAESIGGSTQSPNQVISRVPAVHAYYGQEFYALLRSRDSEKGKSVRGNMGEAKRKTAKDHNPSILIISLGEWEDETGLLLFNLDKESLPEILQNVEQKYPAAPKDRLLHLAKVLIALRAAHENKCGRATVHSVEQLEDMIPQSHIEEMLGPIQ